MNTYTVKMKENEYWYGLCVADGTKFPLGAPSVYEADFTVNPTGNQVAPLFLSNKGRYIYGEACFAVSVKEGTITVRSDGVIELIEADLRRLYYQSAG